MAIANVCQNFTVDGEVVCFCDGSICVMKRLARSVFETEQALSDIRARFLAFTSVNWRHRAHSLVPTPSDATLADFRRALDPEPNRCTTEAVVLLLFALQERDPKSRIGEMSTHREALYEYWMSVDRVWGPGILRSWRYDRRLGMWEGHPLCHFYMSFAWLDLFWWRAREGIVRYEFSKLCRMVSVYQ